MLCLELAAQHPRHLTGIELDAYEFITARLLRSGEFHDGARKQEPLVVLSIPRRGARDGNAIGVVDCGSWRPECHVDVARNRPQAVGRWRRLECVADGLVTVGRVRR